MKCVSSIFSFFPRMIVMYNARTDGPDPPAYNDHICPSPTLSLECSKYSRFGLADHPLLGDKSNYLQHEPGDPVCFAQVIQSGPPNEPSSILGHFAVPIHKFQEYQCHPPRMGHPALHWSHPPPLLRHQDVRNLKVTTPGAHTFAQLRGSVPTT